MGKESEDTVKVREMDGQRERKREIQRYGDMERRRDDAEHISGYMNGSAPLYHPRLTVCSWNWSCVGEVGQNLNIVSFRKEINK